MNIITYHSSNAKPHEAWLAYVELANGEQWLVRFHGATEQEAKEKAIARWASEKDRYAYPEHDDCQMPPVRSGKGSHASAMFAGKVWVINRETHDLKRIDPSELTAYEARGYVRGGPRSK